MFWAPIAASIAGAAVSSMMNKPGEEQSTGTQTQDLPEWLKPYYTGGSEGYAGVVPGQPPINQDYLHWNQMTGMGYPMGPPPPLYVDDPRYTGENVYAPPGTFTAPMNTLALQQDPGGILGQPPQMGGGGYQGTVGPGVAGGGQGGPGGLLQYPSQMTQNPAPAPAYVPHMSDPVTTPAPEEVFDPAAYRRGVNLWGGMEEQSRRISLEDAERMYRANPERASQFANVYRR